MAVGLYDFLNIGKYTKAFGKFFNWAGKGIGNTLSSLGNRITGSHLTGAEREANAFSAQQAQLARDYETEMSNTSYQRGVVDMQKAGVNPALMYGQGAAGASTPSSPSPDSVSPDAAEGPMGILSLIMQMQTWKQDIEAKKLGNDLTREEILNKRADTELKEHTIPKLDAEAGKIAQETNNLKESLEGIQADNALKQVSLKWADREHEAALEFQKMSTDEKAQSIRESVARINNLSMQNKKILADISKTYEEIRLMQTQEALNIKDLERLDSLIKNLDQQTDNLIKTGQLTQKDIDYYQWNHGKMTTFGGLTIHGTEYIVPHETRTDENHDKRRKKKK